MWPRSERNLPARIVGYGILCKDIGYELLLRELVAYPQRGRFFAQPRVQDRGVSRRVNDVAAVDTHDRSPNT